MLKKLKSQANSSIARNQNTPVEKNNPSIPLTNILIVHSSEYPINMRIGVLGYYDKDSSSIRAFLNDSHLLGASYKINGAIWHLSNAVKLEEITDKKILRKLKTTSSLSCFKLTFHDFKGVSELVFLASPAVKPVFLDLISNNKKGFLKEQAINMPSGEYVDASRSLFCLMYAKQELRRVAKQALFPIIMFHLLIIYLLGRALTITNGLLPPPNNIDGIITLTLLSLIFIGMLICSVGGRKILYNESHWLAVYERAIRVRTKKKHQFHIKSTKKP